MEGTKTREYKISFDELLEKFNIKYDKEKEEVWVSEHSYDNSITIKIIDEKLRF